MQQAGAHRAAPERTRWSTISSQVPTSHIPQRNPFRQYIPIPTTNQSSNPYSKYSRNPQFPLQPITSLTYVSQLENTTGVAGRYTVSDGSQPDDCESDSKCQLISIHCRQRQNNLQPTDVITQHRGYRSRVPCWCVGHARYCLTIGADLCYLCNGLSVFYTL